MLKEENKESINYIKSIRIKCFRSHHDISLSPEGASVLIVGSNGVGKTSILEAISIFSYGKGIRNAKFYDMITKDKERFSVDLSLRTDLDFTLEYKTFYNRNNKTRKTFINEKEVTLAHTRKNIPMLWIAPYTEKIFSGPSNFRRSFLDRLVTVFDPRHALRLAEYEKNLRQRSKLLKDKSKDINWISSLEKQLAKSSTAISFSRYEIKTKLSKYLKNSIKNFPQVLISFNNSTEGLIHKIPALDIEESLEKDYLNSREIDSIIGGSRVGCHKSDLEVKNLSLGLNASVCSSGEQKSLLISIILATATAYRDYLEKSPIILLDEVFTHLDLDKKKSLLDKLVELGSQIWITATEKESFFQNNKNFCYHHLTNSGLKNV